MKRPSNEYARMFSAFTAGAFLVVTGAIGYDVRYLHGLFHGGKWVEGFVWWQLGLGAALLLLAVYWLRSLLNASAHLPIVKNVGAGRSEEAERSAREP